MMNTQNFTLTLLLAMGLTGFASGEISVHYNGQSIAFPDAKPTMTGGRVLVPLRAVLDGMGINVKFDPGTSLITASQNQTVVKLTLGSRNASVNGRLVTLDVPAQAVSGRTYVPLRFFGEAFGADVKWRGFDETVLITRDEILNSPNTGQSGIPVAFGLSTNAQGWIRGGQSISFTLSATPNQPATLYLADGTIEVPFRELKPGLYQAEYTVPMKEVERVSFMDADAFAVVGRGADRIALQTTTAIWVDNENPNISNLKPDRLQKIAQRRPAITAELLDPNGSGVVVNSVRLTLNGRDVTSDAVITDRMLVYKPASDLPVGRYEVKITARDKAGNESAVETEFSVVEAQNLVSEFASDSPDMLEPGDVVSFRAKVSDDVRTTRVKLGDQDRSWPLAVGDDRSITFNYTVRKGDSFDDSPLRLLLTLTNGDEVEFVPDLKLTMAGAVTPTPKLNSPEAGISLGRTAVFQGEAQKAEKVRVRVEYVSSVFGLLQTEGLVIEVEVDVKSDGLFTTESIRLGGPLGSTPDQYRITLTSISAKGRESEPVVLIFKG